MTAQLLPYAGLVGLWAALTFMLWRTRRWLVFYLTGAFGFILLVVYGASLLGLDTALEALEATQVAAMAGALGVRLDVLGSTGLAIPNHTGWAVFDIGIECSAIIEMAAALGLIGFYPAFSRGRRVLIAGVGVAATYVINLLRILLIASIINAMGTDWVFAAHAIFGRVFFFVATVVLYWYLLTRPTMRVVRQDLQPALAEDVA